MKDIIRSKRAIRRFIKQLGELCDEYGHKPLYGSKADSEQKIILDPIEMQTVYSAGDVLLEAAADHIFGLCKSITEPALAMAPWTCVRGTLESSAIAFWLFDPRINGTARLRRSFAYRYFGLIEQKKCAISMSDTSAVKIIDARIVQVETQAARFGFCEVKNVKGKRIGIGEVMPSNTQLIKNIFNRETLYRISSAMAHGQNWALINLAYGKTTEKLIFEKQLSIDVLLYLINESAYVFGKAYWSKSKIYGWDLNRIISICRRVWRCLRINNEDYFFWQHD